MRLEGGALSPPVTSCRLLPLPKRGLKSFSVSVSVLPAKRATGAVGHAMVWLLSPTW